MHSASEKAAGSKERASPKEGTQGRSLTRKERNDTSGKVPLHLLTAKAKKRFIAEARERDMLLKLEFRRVQAESQKPKPEKYPKPQKPPSTSQTVVGKMLLKGTSAVSSPSEAKSAQYILSNQEPARKRRRWGPDASASIRDQMATASTSQSKDTPPQSMEEQKEERADTPLEEPPEHDDEIEKKRIKTETTPTEKASEGSDAGGEEEEEEKYPPNHSRSLGRPC